MTTFTRRARFSAGFVASCWLVCAMAAHAAVPGEVQYQGLLLDNVGTPITGTVDLDFELFDALTGGTSLWTESHASVPVLDGVYEVSLGATTPITSAVLAGAGVYLEVTADSETMTPRQRLLAVPYALEAQHAADTDAVAGLGATFVTEMYEHFDFDGAPPSTDPREGLGDADGDGIANFIDPDNDNDGISDSDEELQSTDINVPTPIINSLTPNSARSCAAHSVLVQGANFVPGLGVVLGSQSPVASSVTPTSFSVTVGPQAVASVDITVTNPSGEDRTATGAFSFTDPGPPTITGYSPVSSNFDTTTTVTVQGTDFDPDTTVVFGSQSPTPFNITPTSLDVNVGPQALGSATVTVTNVCAEQAVDSSFLFRDFRIAFATSTAHDGNLGGLAGADAICASRAATAGLSGTYLAWLVNGVTNPATRFTQYTNDYILVDGSKIADDWTDLTDGSLDRRLDLDENGTAVSSQVWTGVLTDGTSLDAGDPNTHCNGFTTNSGFNGGVGTTTQGTALWTYNSVNTTRACSETKRLYCFQQ